MNTYDRIREKLDAIPIVDDHSHVLHYNIEPNPVDGPYEVLPLSQLLLNFSLQLHVFILTFGKGSGHFIAAYMLQHIVNG